MSSQTSRPSTAHAALGSQNNSPGTTTPNEEHSDPPEHSSDIQEPEDVRTFEQPDSELPPLPSTDDISFLPAQSDFGDSQLHNDESALLEKEMKRKLMDVESSFLPEAEPSGHAPGAVGADDTYLFGGSPGNSRSQSSHHEGENEGSEARPSIDPSSDALPSAAHIVLSESPATPSEAYKTPALEKRTQPESEALALEYHNEDTQVGAEDAGDSQDDSASIVQSSVPPSPAAAAAERKMARTAYVSDFQDDTSYTNGSISESQDTTYEDARSEHPQRPSSQASTVRGTDAQPQHSERQTSVEDSPTVALDSAVASTVSNMPSSHLYKRPSFLNSRQASQRSSVSSFSNRSDLSNDAASEITLNADYALQTGGAAPYNSALSSSVRPSFGLSRLPSLGSIASSVSGYSDSVPVRNRALRSVSGTSIATGHQGERNLERLDEEEGANILSAPATPRPSTATTIAPTDTVITRHVQNIRVPDTIAKEYREKHAEMSDKQTMGMSFNSRGRNNLTLKEQNSKIDKLSKENFDLKLKIHFLDQALQNRSDEGVKDMINKNVQLQTDLANEKKENQTLRRKVRELERKLQSQEDGQATARRLSDGSEDEKSRRSSQAELEEEITYLREVLHQYEVQIEKLKEDSLAKEVEKRRLAEYVKSVSERRDSEPTAGVEEAMEMWKDLLEAETARREQADEDAQKLREEIARLKSETASNAGTTNNVRNYYHISKRHITSYNGRSHSVDTDSVSERERPATASSSTLVEQLRHENAELRRDLGAQTSMLTSRNRERERLQQEIEELKLAQRKVDGARSVAGDSIFERSVSRAHQRSASRMSGVTRISQFSDAEREEYEGKQAALRDEIAQIKLLNQDLDRELNAHLDILTQFEAENRTLKEENRLNTEDLQALQTERDEALLSLQDKEVDFENLREEALTEIERLESEMEQKEQQLVRLQRDYENRNEDFGALQQEIKRVSESLVALEDNRVENERKIRSMEQELEDANNELDTLDRRLREAQEKNERLEVQTESNQDEISFLREEQESDKIRIGDLEAALNAAQTSLQDEKERMRELEERLSEERRQHEILDSQEKAEVQKVLDDLNTQASTAKDEVRKLKKNLSAKEEEAATWKERLEALENNLREALGNLDGTRSSLLKDITKLQKDLDLTVHDLENARHDLAEKDRLLRTRDALLESTGLESRKLSDLLDKERQARKSDLHHFEQTQRAHQTELRKIQQHETHVLELKTARGHDARKLAALEQQYRDQLLDRNNLLLALWNRLSTLCGADWAQKHSLVNGELPSLDVIQRNLAGFSKNVILAVQTVEGIVGGFRARIRSVEKDLWKDFQTLEHALDVRAKRLEGLEKAVAVATQGAQGRRAESRASAKSEESEELRRLKGENRALKAELQFHRQVPLPPLPQQPQRQGSVATLEVPGINGPSPRSPSGGSHKDASRASMAATLLRHHSTSAVQVLQAQQQGQGHVQPVIHSQPLQPSEQRWIHRLKELERRLKAEREARLLDRSGARKRIEEGRAENEELRMMLEREKERRVSLEFGGGEEDGRGRRR